MMLKCILLDANIIIEAYELGIWVKLIDQIHIIVSSIVAYKESLFYSKQHSGIPEAINLKKLVSEGKIQEIEATQNEIDEFYNKFDTVFAAQLHDGEAESLTLIMHNKVSEAFYCSGDAPAIRALAMIGHSDKGISFETILKHTGLQKGLKKQFREHFFRTNLKLGQQNLITGQGLS